MRSVSFVAAPSTSVDRAPARLSPFERVVAYLRGSLVNAEMDVRKLRHDPLELVTRAIQPVLWLTIFGQAFASIRAIPTGGVGYLAFITPRHPGPVVDVRLDLLRPDDYLGPRLGAWVTGRPAYNRLWFCRRSDHNRLWV